MSMEGASKNKPGTHTLIIIIMEAIKGATRMDKNGSDRITISRGCAVLGAVDNIIIIISSAT